MKQIKPLMKPFSKALLTEANKVGLKIEDEVPTINKIKNAVYAAKQSLPKN